MRIGEGGLIRPGEGARAEPWSALSKRVPTATRQRDSSPSDAATPLPEISPTKIQTHRDACSRTCIKDMFEEY